MELLLDVVFGGLGYLIVRMFNRVLGTKVSFGDGGYVVTGFLFLVAVIALSIVIADRVWK
jgi:hypothetical protein